MGEACLLFCLSVEHSCCRPCVVVDVLGHHLSEHHDAVPGVLPGAGVVSRSQATAAAAASGQPSAALPRPQGLAGMLEEDVQMVRDMT